MGKVNERRMKRKERVRENEVKKREKNDRKRIEVNPLKREPERRKNVLLYINLQATIIWTHISKLGSFPSLN